MPSPFPGMNPYLESPELWSDFHHRLIAALADFLAPQLEPKYIVAIERRIYEITAETPLLVGIPDVMVQRPLTDTNLTTTNVIVLSPPAQPVTVTLPLPESVRQGYLEVRKVGTNQVIAAIEILSPVNKRPGKGREIYEAKRQNVVLSSTHFVEIDLLRQWEPMPILETQIESDYRILVSRRERRPFADLYAFNLTDSLPKFSLPLLADDLEPVIDLKTLLDLVYDRAVYRLQIDYNSDPIPVLNETEATWADELLKQQELRDLGQ
jgi:Protein of unknown function (DUF4058)